jgi:glycosyl-4,4'-diaponeurosporenoate acyltransferase
MAAETPARVAMVVELHWSLIVALNAVVWVAWSFAVGYRQARRPAAELTPGALGRIRTWENHGRWYRDRLRVHRWKDRLPEAGDWFGGLSKRRLPDAERGGLARFAQECLRAERTHVGIMAITPAFWLWNPPVAFAANVVFALVANLPCLIVGRYNRARVERVLERQAGTLPRT